MTDITYTRVGDYLLPDIILWEPQPECVAPLGKYARMHRVSLQEHRPIFYNTFLLSEQLYPHLRAIDEAASARKSKLPLPTATPEGARLFYHITIPTFKVLRTNNYERKGFHVKRDLFRQECL